MIVDIGAFINILGADLARQLAVTGISHGHQPSQVKLARTLSIHGVGQGSQSCNWSVNVPAAVRIKTPPTASSTGGVASSEQDEETAKLVRIESPVCEGTGSSLPGLLGLRTIEKNNGVIETIQGQAYLTFPGPGGYKIIWEPGALHMPLTKANSGYLCLEVDHYEKIPSSTSGGLREESSRVLYSGQSSSDTSTSLPATSRTADAGTQTDPWLPES